MIHLIYLHLIVNAFIAGLYFNSIVEKSKNSRVLLLIMLLLIQCFADIIYVIVFLYYFVGFVFKDTAIGFFVDWHTGYYEKMPIDERNNLIAVSKWKVETAEKDGIIDKSAKWKAFKAQAKKLADKYDPENKIPANQYGYELEA